MWGTLAEGDCLWVSSVPFDSLQAGDVVAFDSGGKVVAHRIVEKSGTAFTTQGDGNWRRDSVPLTADRLVGRVMERERHGVRKPVTSGARGRLRGAILRAICRLRRRWDHWLWAPFLRLVSISRAAAKSRRASGLASCPEMDLLCKCIAPLRAGGTEPDPPDPREREGRPPCRPMEIDWPKFMELATNHHVLPLVYKTLKSDAGNGIGLPTEWFAQLRARQTPIAAYNMRALALLRRLQRLMEASGIRLVPIKGPALALLAYGDVARRQFEDLDLLVRREDLLRAVELLEREGYRLRELSDSVCRARYVASLQNWSLEKAGSPPLDLKPVLVSHALTGPASAEFMAAACRRIPIDEKRSLAAPGPEAMLLAVCLDGANDMWFKLSSVADVGALLVKYADRDWGGFLGAAARLGQRRSVLVGSGLAEELLGCDLPPAFREGDRQDPVARRLARRAADRLRALAPRHSFVGRQTWFALQTRERLRDRFRFLSRLLFVPGAYELAAWPLPGVLQPLHALMRPGRLAWDLLVRKGRHRRLTVRSADEKVRGEAKNE